MKEKYFSLDTIDTKAIELLVKAKNGLQDKKQLFLPEKSALIVMDMQKYFCEESSHAFIPSAAAIIPKIKKLVEVYNSHNLPVIFTHHVNTAENAGLMGKWWSEVIQEENNLSEIIDEFNTVLMWNDKIFLVKKSQYDAFYNTELEDVLKQNNISQLVVTGVMTHLCCETTARSAFVRGFKVFTPVDATATYNESFHFASMLNLVHGFSSLAMTEEICQNILKEKSDL